MHSTEQILRCSHPILSLVVSAALFSVALHSPSQRTRLYLLPLFLASSIFSFTSSKYFAPFLPSLVSLWSLGVSLNILHVISVLFIEKWPAPQSPAAPSTPRHATSKNSWGRKFRATYKIWGNPQLLPEMTPSSAQSPTERNIYFVFYFLRLIKLPIHYSLHTYILPALFSEMILDFYPEDVGPVQQTLLRRLTEVTAREMVVRSYIAIIWIMESVVLLDAANSVIACSFVLLGLDHPSDWPALYGNLLSATSLRKFWSKFWHRLAVRPYSNYGKVIASRLGLRHESFAFKTIVAFVVFALSGASHSAVSWNVGQRDWHLEFYWFLLNFVGCTAELLVLSAVRSFAKSMGWSRELKMIEESWFGSFVGFSWVFGFFFWSTPKLKFPSLHREAVLKEVSRLLWSKMSVVGN